MPRLFCFSLIVGGALLALVPVLLPGAVRRIRALRHNTVGLLYVGVICLSISLVGNLLLGLEVVLTWRQLRHLDLKLQLKKPRAYRYSSDAPGGRCAGTDPEGLVKAE